MHILTDLLENFWILREEDSSAFFRIKKSIDKPFKTFLNDFPGWTLIVTHNAIKLEKRPAEARPFMGIKNFEAVSDYCLLCALLIFLDDRHEGDQFLLSEMTESLETIISGKLDIDLTRFSDRKSLVRVLKFAEEIHLLKVWEGSSDRLEYYTDREILYENTGLSDLFAIIPNMDISDCGSYRDLEDRELIFADRNRGSARTNRVYRRLLLCPAMYRGAADDPDMIYLKNQRSSISEHLGEYLGGRLDIHGGSAFYMLDENEVFGDIHPSDNSVSKFTLLLCGLLREKHMLSEEQSFPYSEDDYNELIIGCRKKWGGALSKQLREMPEAAFVHLITDYLACWMLLEKTENGYAFREGIFKTVGVFPPDYNGDENNGKQ